RNGSQDSRKMETPSNATPTQSPATSPGAHFQQGEACRTREQWDQAIGHFSAVILLDPQFAHAYFKRGTIKLRRGQHDEAIADYIEAICLDPDNAAYRNNRGRDF